MSQRALRCGIYRFVFSDQLALLNLFWRFPGADLVLDGGASVDEDDIAELSTRCGYRPLPDNIWRDGD